MNLLFWIIAFTLIGGILSVIAASLFLLIPDHHRSRILPHGISFALGALLAVAFLDLLPHAVEAVGAERSETVFAAVLLGILALFCWKSCCFGGIATPATARLIPTSTFISLPVRSSYWATEFTTSWTAC